MKLVGFLLAGLPWVAFAQPYPLCAGSVWNSPSSQSAGALIERLSAEKSTPEASGALGKLPWRGLASEPAFQLPIAAAPKSSLSTTAALTAAVKGQLGNPGVFAYWNDASAALRLLPLKEQNDVVRKAFPGLPDAGLAIRKVAPSLLAERLKLVKVDAQLVGLQKTLDPLTLRAYLDAPTSALSDSELLDRFGDTSFRALTLRLAPLVRENGPLKLKLGNGTVQMVGVGEGVRPGGLGLVPSPQPVAFGLLTGGEVCVRPAVKSDWKLDPASNKIRRAWDPKGFRDVGLLLWRTNDGKGKVSNPKICSFVRVGGPFAVTAAHCVIESGAGAQVRKRNYHSSGLEAVALLPRLDAVELNPEGCFDTPSQCGYFVSRLRTVPELPVGISWPSSAGGPSPDVALLTLPFEANAPVATTGVTSGAAQADRLTLAGYGLANATGAYDWGSLLVGWQQHPPQLDATSLIWSVDVNNGSAGGCGGDSGGAVYEGDIAGLPNEVRVLGGIISSGELPQTGASEVGKCAASKKGRAARLDIHYSWLCKQSSNAVLGCPGTEIAASK